MKRPDASDINALSDTLAYNIGVCDKFAEDLMQPCPLQITACQMRSKSPCCPLASICMRAKAVHWLQTNAMVAPLVSQRLHCVCAALMHCRRWCHCFDIIDVARFQRLLAPRPNLGNKPRRTAAKLALRQADSRRAWLRGGRDSSLEDVYQEISREAWTRARDCCIDRLRWPRQPTAVDGAETSGPSSHGEADP